MLVIVSIILTITVETYDIKKPVEIIYRLKSE